MSSISFKSRIIALPPTQQYRTWEKISKKFEKEIDNSEDFDPDYDIYVKENNNGELNIVINRGIDDELPDRKITLNANGFKKLIKLPTEKIVDEFKNLLELVQKRDLVYEYAQRIASAMQIFSHNRTPESDKKIIEDLQKSTNAENKAKIEKNPIWSEHISSANIYNKF